MKKKLYTLSHNIENLNKLDQKTVFSSEEHSLISERELKDSLLLSKDKLIEHSINDNWKLKYLALHEAINRIKEKGFKKIISFGSGFSDLEYFLYLGLDKNIEIVSSDFDTFLVKKSNEFFPEFKTIRFDFFNDSISSLNEKFDLAIFFGSAYVMDDLEFIRLFKDIKKSGVLEIIDFHAGYMTRVEHFKNYIRPAYHFLKNFFYHQDKYLGKFHGYSRSKNELIKLYNQSGWKTHKIIWDRSCYKFSCILDHK